MKGKERCRILKEIRQRIAEENHIEFITSECSHKGDCTGTCPKCESEVRYLERELLERQKLGKRIAVAGIATGIALSSVGCSPFKNRGSDVNGDLLPHDIDEKIESTDSITLEGEVVESTAGVPTPEVPYFDDEGNELVIEGDIAIPPLAGALPLPENEECFFAEDITEYDYYDEEFISRCLEGEHIDRIRHAWGEPDFQQSTSEGLKVSYFTDLRDILLYIELPSCSVTKVEIIENE